MLSKIHKRALLILAIPLALAAGLVWIATHDLLELPWNQSGIPFHLIAAIGVVAGILWAFFAARRLEIQTAIIAGATMGTACAGIAFILLPFVQFANSKFDFQAPRTVEAFVTDKRTEKHVGRRTSRLAYLISIETPLEATASRTISVKYSMWDTVNKGDRIRIRIGRGLLWPYVAGIEKLPRENPGQIHFPINRSPISNGLDAAEY